MKAIFEVEFDPELMCDSDVLQELYDGSWDECIKSLYESEGLGMFEPENIKFISVD